jgi:hypothetical protein
MRRRIDGEPTPFFRGGELPRLMTMLVMLAVIGMLIARAKDPRTWSMFASVSEEQGRAGDPDVPPPEYDEPSVPAASTSDTQSSASPSLAEQPPEERSAPSDPKPSRDRAAIKLPELPPLDEDAEEREAFKEEMQVITDNDYLQKIEMPAYYRLFRWVLSQSTEELQRRAEKDPRFGEVYTRPDAYRGKLVDIRLHVRQAIKHKDLEEDNPAGLTQTWELAGYNDSSGHNFYMCTTPELPPDMPVGKSVAESGRFVGYFFKLMAYEDRQGKHRATPLFVGRFIWDPPVLQRADPKQQEREVMWGFMAAAVISAMLFIRWGLRRMKPASSRSITDTRLREMRRRRSMQKDSDEENVDINTWLDQVESANADSAINQPEMDESDGEEKGR